MKGFVLYAVRCLFIIAASVAVAWADPVYTQTIDLKPGWNAVFLEVEAAEANSSPDIFFKGDGVVSTFTVGNITVEGKSVLESVWTWAGGQSIAEFVDDPNKVSIDKPGWHGYFTADQEKVLSNLYSINANRAFLIKVKGVQPVRMSVRGTPKLSGTQWLADSFNLLGFHIRPDNPPTFTQFFASSKAHAGQAMYRLSDLGKWEYISDPATAMKSGEAYWIYCEGASDYSGPVTVAIPANNLNFENSSLAEKTIVIKNQSSETRSVSLQMLDDNPGIFSYRRYIGGGVGVAGPFDYPDISTIPAQNVDANGSVSVTIHVNTQNMTTPSVIETVLAISDDLGGRVLVPVKAVKK